MSSIRPKASPPDRITSRPRPMPVEHPLPHRRPKQDDLRGPSHLDDPPDPNRLLQFGCFCPVHYDVQPAAVPPILGHAPLMRG